MEISFENIFVPDERVQLAKRVFSKDVATGVQHHLVPGDFVFFHVGSKVEFSTKSDALAFYAVTRPVKTAHPNLKGREEYTKSQSRL